MRLMPILVVKIQAKANWSNPSISHRIKAGLRKEFMAQDFHRFGLSYSEGNREQR